MNEHFIKIKYVLYYTRICANSGIRKLDNTKRITSIQQSQTDNRDYFEITKILFFKKIIKSLIILLMILFTSFLTFVSIFLKITTGT